MAKIINSVSTKCWVRMGRNPYRSLVHCWWECTAAPENNLALKKKQTLHTTNTKHSDVLMWNENRKQMFVAILFAITPNWKLPKCTSVSEWLKLVMRNPHSVILLCNKKGKSQNIEPTQQHNFLQRIVLDERNQCQKIACHCVPFIEHSWNDKNRNGDHEWSTIKEEVCVGGRRVALKRHQEGPDQMLGSLNGSISGSWHDIEL
jgi:hypothetical protein